MPMQRHLYPPNWEQIAFQLKQRARWRCQWCDRPCRRPGETILAFAERIARSKKDCQWFTKLTGGIDVEDFANGEIPIKWHLGKFTLTVAHLDHDPENPIARLKALCAPCHASYDLRQMGRKRRLKAERDGQLTLKLETDT